MLFCLNRKKTLLLLFFFAFSTAEAGLHGDCLEVLAQQCDWFGLLEEEEQLAMAHALKWRRQAFSKLDQNLCTKIEEFSFDRDALLENYRNHTLSYDYRHGQVNYQDLDGDIYNLKILDPKIPNAKLCFLHNMANILNGINMNNKIRIPNGPDAIISMLKEVSDREIMKLDISSNDLGLCTLEEFIEIIRSIPKSVWSLDISCNNLYRFGVRKVVEALSNLSQSIRRLNIGQNGFERLGLDAIITIANSIPEVVRFVSGLTTFKTADLVKFVSAIPKNFQEFKLDYTHDTPKAETNIFQAVKLLNPNIKLLSLSVAPHFCQPGRLEPWQKIIDNIPGSIQTAKLCLNFFWPRTPSDFSCLLDLLSGLSPSLYALRLSNIDLSHLSDEQLEAFFNAISKSVRALIIDDRFSVLACDEIAKRIRMHAEDKFDFFDITFQPYPSYLPWR